MASRKQSFVGGDGFDVLFDGSKSYWKTRSNLDILVASHKKQLCIEVVAYNAEIGVEAPRLYMSSMLLATKINPQSEEFTSKLSNKKEVFNRQKKSYSVPELTKEVYNDLILDYIMKRLTVVAEGVDLTKELKMTINPMSGDTVKEDDPTQVDFIISMPPTLTPVTVTYQKKASASEISRAQHKLQSESAALKNATRLAELATSATENFKAMMEEKRRIAMEMRAYSKPRLRWIKVINRVLIMNYIESAKRRLLNSSFREWFLVLMEKAAAEEAAEAEAAAAAEKAAQAERDSLARQRSILAANASSKSNRGGVSGDRSKNKVARRSLDNSQLPSLSNINIDIPGAGESTKMNVTPTAGGTALPVLGSPSAKNMPEKLLLDPMERRRQAKAEAEAQASMNGGVTSAKLSKIGKALSRRSFGGETEAELTKSLAAITKPTEGGDGTGMPGVVAAPQRPPSLLESYSMKGAQMVSIPNIDITDTNKSTKLESKSVPRRARA